MKKTYPVLTAKAAVKDYNKKVAGFQAIEARFMAPADRQAMTEQKALQDKAMASQGQSSGEQRPKLSQLLQQAKLPGSFAARHRLATQLGLSRYHGTEEEDNQLADALSGKLAHEGSENERQQQSEQTRGDQALKQKELELKAKELEASTAKLPTADEIADSLLKKSNNKDT